MRFLSLFRRSYSPLNKITISKNRLLNNFNYLSNVSKDISIAPVLKSNAYGHGLLNIAKIIDSQKAPFLCVDSLYEAYELIKENIKTPILIMGYVHPENLKVKRLPFSYAVYDKESAVAINKYQPSAKIHIFVDTGMHREGISINELPEFLRFLMTLKNLKIEGLMSHFAVSEEPKNIFTQKQIKNFKSAVKILNNEGIFPKWIHIGNSGAVLNYKEYEKEIGNVCRSGIALYGIDPEGRNNSLEPVLELKTILNQVKLMQKDEKAGYSFTFTAKKDMTIGILPLGYNDGIDRNLSNTGGVSINGIWCPIIGRVSMNLTTVDLSKLKDPLVGREVVVYSRNTKDQNSIYNLAEKINTIPYELLVNLTTTTKRFVID